MLPRFAVESLPGSRTRSRASIDATVPGRARPEGEFVVHEGEEYYCISHVDRLPPFLTSVASDGDAWIFVSSRGGLTAGRVDAEGSLFPYETVDRLHDGHHHTGPITSLRVLHADGRRTRWEPFCDREELPGAIERNLYKNTIGNRLVFEEVHRGLDLALRVRWTSCAEFGLVRTVVLENLGEEDVGVEVLDGLRNVLPFGAPLSLYQQSSSLVDAYKRVDVDPRTSLAIFSLTSKILDRAEAAEELRANVVWCTGLGKVTVSASADALAAFRRGEEHVPSTPLTGRRSNYFVHGHVVVPAGASRTWHVVADVGRDHVQIAALRARLLQGEPSGGEIEAALDAASENLLRFVSATDGVQLTGHPEAAVHHFASVLFNDMRGGVFADGHRVERRDFVDFLATRNRAVAARHRAWCEALADSIDVRDLDEAARATGDVDLRRLVLEYLPLTFSRRHGDPSRPWNRFRIAVTEPDGSRALRYEGNWRDIFQNWEALLTSHPAFLPHVVAKFLNASTVDGFNPYRITRDGIDWEVVDPDDPWSYIGYWGDHQIVYLLRLLEMQEAYAPGSLASGLDDRIYGYADVPYRLVAYDRMVENPYDTIHYDAAHAARIAEREEVVGTDARCVHRDGEVVHVGLLEKLLVPALSKLSNFVPGAGIWMNTQRPEWNDANNALVGNGVSVVTLCHLRRYLAFLAEIVETAPGDVFTVSAPVVRWFEEIDAAFAAQVHPIGPGAEHDVARRGLLDTLGRAFERYRERVYAEGPGDPAQVDARSLLAFVGRALVHVDAAIESNRRPDGLYHAYDLVDTRGGRAQIHRLYEMLEGQVAALSSGLVDPASAVSVLHALFDSPMYAADRRSFLLYPERELADFLARNAVAEGLVDRVGLLRAMIDAGDARILARDASGVVRFAADLVNEAALRKALDCVGADDRWRAAVTRDREAVLEVFEEVFEHRAFTGRSGTMYGYEGIGCIYWHMVAKLLLAVQEIHRRAVDEERPAALVAELADLYQRIRHGLGFAKSVEEWGAFPTDPYSHTPRHAGAQQPGMTGQVKEEILTRLGELGVGVRGGIVTFVPRLLARRELLTRASTYHGHDVTGLAIEVAVPAQGLAFTFCQVPVVYESSDRGAWIRVVLRGGETRTRPGASLTAEESADLFTRSGAIERIEVGIAEHHLLEG